MNKLNIFFFVVGLQLISIHNVYSGTGSGTGTGSGSSGSGSGSSSGSHSVAATPSPSPSSSSSTTSNTTSTTTVYTPPSIPLPCNSVNTYVQAGLIPPQFSPDYWVGAKTGDFCIMPAHSVTVAGKTTTAPASVGYVANFPTSNTLTCSTTPTLNSGYTNIQSVSDPKSTWFTNTELSSKKTLSQELTDALSVFSAAQKSGIANLTPAQVKAAGIAQCNH